MSLGMKASSSALARLVLARRVAAARVVQALGFCLMPVLCRSVPSLRVAVVARGVRVWPAGPHARVALTVYFSSSFASRPVAVYSIAMKHVNTSFVVLCE